MGSYDSLMPYPLEYTQVISNRLHGTTHTLLGDADGIHLGTAVAGLGVVAGLLGNETEGGRTAVALMGTTVAWGKLLGLAGMEEVPVIERHHLPKKTSAELAYILKAGYEDVLVDQGAARETWGTLLIISAMDLAFQAKDVLAPSVPKTIILSAIADGIKISEKAGRP
jgi:hypothetical protein